MTPSEKMARNIALWLKIYKGIDFEIDPWKTSDYLDSWEFKEIERELQDSFAKDENGIYSIKQMQNAYKNVTRRLEIMEGEIMKRIRFKSLMIKFHKVSGGYVWCNFCCKLVCRCPNCLLNHNHDDMLRKTPADKVVLHYHDANAVYKNPPNLAINEIICRN